MITLERNLIRPKDSVYFKISINYGKFFIYNVFGHIGQ